jgi:hypothetical protein
MTTTQSNEANDKWIKEVPKKQRLYKHLRGSPNKES